MYTYICIYINKLFLILVIPSVSTDDSEEFPCFVSVYLWMYMCILMFIYIRSCLYTYIYEKISIGIHTYVFT
jgi:hypothetical protein